MTRNPIAIIWLVGILAAVLAYLGDGTQIVAFLADLAQAATLQLELLVDRLNQLSIGLVRALAIGLFVTFAALAALAVRRGLKGRAALVLVTLGFAWAVRQPDGWADALLLAGTAAAVMTLRLSQRGGLVRAPQTYP